MIARLGRVYQKVRYFYRIHPVLPFRLMMRRLISPLYRKERGYVTYWPVNGYESGSPDDDSETACIFVDAPEGLLPWKKRQYSPFIPFNKLERHLAGGTGNFAILATLPQSPGEQAEIVGYRMCQRGWFSDDWGVEGRLPDDTLFVVYTEVFPEYRGRRINRRMVDATMDYCRQNGIAKIVGVISEYNTPSMKHFFRVRGNRFIACIEMRSILGGLYKRITPFEDIKKAIEDE